MKNSIWIIMKKEFARFFGDKRMILTTILLPGIMIYLLYSLMGSAMSDATSGGNTYKYRIYAENLPESLKPVFYSDQYENVTILPDDLAAECKKQLKNGILDLYVVFPKDFDEKVGLYNTEIGGIAPNIDIYFNSSLSQSSGAYSKINSVLAMYETKLSNKFDINNNAEKHDVATKNQTTAKLFAMMLPMLLMTFIYSGCIAVVTESIAGEKERGTIATLLVTPINRRALVMGKIFSLSLLALLSGISSFIGTIFSLPKLMGSAGESLNAAIYAVSDYFMLLAVILSTVLVIVSIISIVSTFAKTVKEATTAVTPIMIVVMLIGVSSMFGDGAVTNHSLYCIPLYNSVQCMSGIFSLSYEPINIVITLISNIAVSTFMIFGLTKMFNSEKIMFSK
ncbi:MAG: ABC transporter permease [Clostridia bacterium]